MDAAIQARSHHIHRVYNQLATLLVFFLSFIYGMDVRQVCEITRSDPPNDSLLEWALRKGVPLGTLHDLILTERCDPAERNASALVLACSLGRDDAVRLFLKAYSFSPYAHHVSVSMDNDRALRTARRCEHRDVILSLILHSDADARIDDHELLVYAVELNDSTLVRTLVDWRQWCAHTKTDAFVDPYANDALAIRRALARGNTEIIRLVLIDWKHPNGDTYTPRTSTQRDILRASAALPYVHDAVDTMWKTSPRLELPYTPLVPATPTVTAKHLVEYYDDSGDDDPEDDIVIIADNDDIPCRDLRNSTPRTSVASHE